MISCRRHGLAGLCVLLVMAGTIVRAAGQPQTDTDKVAQVTAGTLTEANMAWWGFDEHDSTEAFQAALKSGARKITVPNMGKPWIITPVRMQSNTELILEDGVVVMAKKGEFRGISDSLITISSNLENITIRGYGATLLMHKADYQSSDYEKSERRHGIRIRGSRNIKIYGLTIRSSGGDGILISTDETYPVSQDIHIKDVVCDDNHRQGISLVSGRNVLIEDCVLKNTSGTAPSAGIDCEPDRDGAPLSNVIIRNCQALNNEGPGFMVYYLLKSRKAPPVSVLVENCLVDGASTGLVVGGNRSDGPKGRIEFRDCTVRNTRDYGISVYDKAYEGALTKFTRCTFSNVAQTRLDDFDPAGDDKGSANKESRPNSAFLIYAKRPQLAPRIGGVEFADCVLEDNHDRPWLAVAGNGAFEVSDVRGNVTIKNPHGVRMETPTALQVKGIPAAKP